MVFVLFVTCLQRGLRHIGLLSMLLHVIKALELLMHLCFMLSDFWGIVYAWNFPEKFAGMICASNCHSILCIRPIGLMLG